MLGGPATYGKTRYAGEPGLYHVIVRFRSEAGMRLLLETAVELVDGLVDGKPYPLQVRLTLAREVIAEVAQGPSTGAMVEAAERRGITMAPLERRQPGPVRSRA
jgi:cyanophycin synthetase